MKAIMGALGKAIEALLSAKTLWFVIVIAAVTCVLLTLYFNGMAPMGMGCPSRAVGVVDALGLCKNFLEPNQHWIGLIAVISIIMIVMGTIAWAWKLLMSMQFPPGVNQWIGRIAVFAVVAGILAWAGKMLVSSPPQSITAPWWVEWLAFLMVVSGGALWAWQSKKQQDSLQGDKARK